VKRLAATLGLALTLACVSVPTLQPGQEPALDADEAGLWMQMERVEKSLRTSGAIVTDPVVNDYVNALVCDLAPEYCEGVRVYVVLTPHFNATMRPNGAMEVWTGLMLRAENEAQLCAVIGHEIAHYSERHTLERWRQAKSTTNILMYFNIVTAMAGHGYIGSLAELAAIGSFLAYSRGQEEEADQLGLARLAKAGYDPTEAAKVWWGLIEENEAGDEDEPMVFLSTHPASESRADSLEELGAQKLTESNRGVTGQERFLEVSSRIRAETVRELLRQRTPKRTEVVLDRLEESGVPSAEVAYYRAELYRIRDEGDDEERAIDWYRAAIASEDAPPEAYRALGLISQRRGDKEAARRYLELYLEVNPAATDRLMIQSYLADLQ
jgi:predicted Zn-dependent protease